MKASLIKELYPCFGTKQCNPKNRICENCQHVKKCYYKVTKKKLNKYKHLLTNYNYNKYEKSINKI